MKRFTTILLSLTFAATTLFANPIDPEKACEIALGFWNRTVGTDNKCVLMPISRTEMSKAGSRFATPKTNPGFYIFTPENERGFVIISGDDELPAIVGYSTTANAGEMPPALRDLLNVYDMYVEDVRNGIAKPAQYVTTASNNNIGPMLTTTWDQGTPYNIMCPQIGSSYTPTGCTATALAQIMKFHNWPDKPSKSFTWSNNVTEREETVNTSSHRYDWTNMLDSYKSGYTDTEAKAVALLMSDVGKAMNSAYALNGTGATPYAATQVLVNIFKYTPEIIHVQREEYTNEEYIELIRTNLEARQPVMYAGHGQDYSSGHAFVCDGINENNLLHINWGWSGAYDGYFDITNMAPGGAGIGGGEDRYNVGQAIIANIRPRVTGESNVNGEPTLYSMYILNPDTDPDKGEEYQILGKSVKAFTDNTSRQRIAFALLNWSHSTTKMMLKITFEKDGKIHRSIQLNDVDDLIELKMNEDSGGHYIADFDISNTAGSDSYLEQGTYNVRVCYSDGKNDYKPIRGVENDIVIEVAAKETRAYIMKPEVKVTEVTFRRTPSEKGDPLSFDAKFENTNKRNSTVIITPVLNRKISDNAYKSDTLESSTAMITIYDDQEITASFAKAGTFPQDGIYHISFVYNLMNSYTGEVSEYALPVAGKSKDITISPLPEGLILSTTELSAPAITYGEKANITATVKNISTSDDSFTGRLAIFAKEDATGKDYLLTSIHVDNLEKGATTNISYQTPDYLPIMQPGSHTISIRQACNGKWKELRQSAATGILNIAPTTATIPYINGVMDINNGNDVVVQGEKFDVNATLSCLNADFDGYLRVNVVYGLSYHARSEYIPISIKKNGTANVTIPCNTKVNNKLDRYRLSIIYYDSNKKKLGDMSNNTFSYNGNGYFWIGDGTGIEKIEDTGSATVTVCGNCIDIANADGALVTVYSTDGREVYKGTESTVPVADGLYIVAIQQQNGTITATKVLVK